MAKKKVPGLIARTEIGDMGTEYKLAIFDPETAEKLAELKYRAFAMSEARPGR